jgi:hypothetical protein
MLYGDYINLIYTYKFHCAFAKRYDGQPTIAEAEALGVLEYIFIKQILLFYNIVLILKHIYIFKKYFLFIF